MKLAVAAAGIVLMAGTAGWGGSMIALSSSDSTSADASNPTAEARPSASTASSARTGTSATTTQPTAAAPPAPAFPADMGSTPARDTSAVPQHSTSAVPQNSQVSRLSPDPDERDILFVSPSPDSFSDQWYYRIGLLGFPADTVIEISGQDTYGNPQVAPLVMTTAEGSWNPFTTGFGGNFAYGGTCDDAQPATVTARGKGFSVTETAPRPLECDGGTTSNGPWTPPTYPTPVTSAPPSEPWGG